MHCFESCSFWNSGAPRRIPCRIAGNVSKSCFIWTDAHKNHQKRVHGRQDELDVSGLASLPAVASSTSDNATVAQEFKCKEAGFFGSDEDCTLFYRCVDYFGTGEHFSLFTFQCAPGTIFDQSISVCNHPDWVEPKPKCLKASEEPATGASSAQGKILFNNFERVWGLVMDLLNFRM